LERRWSRDDRLYFKLMHRARNQTRKQDDFTIFTQNCRYLYYAARHARVDKVWRDHTTGLLTPTRRRSGGVNCALGIDILTRVCSLLLTLLALLRHADVPEVIQVVRLKMISSEPPHLSRPSSNVQISGVEAHIYIIQENITLK
jgi:hypothetical protein